MTDSRLTRRRFLTGLGCASLGSTTLFSSLVHLGAASSAAAQTITPGDDYRALVCILLAGGNDSYNMLVPYDTPSYAGYQASRTDLALPRSGLLPLTGQGTAGGRRHAVHPAMPEVRDLYDAGRLAFVSNVGTLVEPINLTQFHNGSRKVPLGLFSHSDQIEQWQTAIPDARAVSGWGGRLAETLQAINQDDRISMNISLAGTNAFQTGTQVAEYSITPQGSVGFTGYGAPGALDQLRTTGLDSLMNATYRNLFEQGYADRLRGARDANALFREALTASTTPSTVFGADELGQSLAMVARTISARQALGHRRQTFFVLFGGWDHHDEVLVSQQGMLSTVSQALGAFRQSMVELGVDQQVTTFTISDFGRTLTSNGRGSDHGWGGNQLVMGGGVRGGRVFGTYPSLAPNNELDTGRGRLIPTTSVDAYFGELAMWLGVAPSDLDRVLPNVGRFYTPSLSAPPLGFLLG